MPSKQLERKGLIVGGENFFESGGDSLAPMMLHAGVVQRLQQQLEFSDALAVVAGADFHALAELVGGTTAGARVPAEVGSSHATA